jgi:hypothetical protein
LGFGLVKAHPFGNGNRSSREQGPDFVVRDDMTGLYYVEVKWWDASDSSIAAAHRQGELYCKKNPFYEDEKVVGAYIAIVQWDIRTTLMMIRVEKVRL